MSRRVAPADHQPDLFARPADAPIDSLVDTLEEHPGEEFIQRIRDDLNAKLALVRDAARFPWPNLTRVYSEEMRINSMSRWLPRTEAIALRRAFAAEMDRLYEAEDEARPMVPGADF
jgi:hypothetical protein